MTDQTDAKPLSAEDEIKAFNAVRLYAGLAGGNMDAIAYQLEGNNMGKSRISDAAIAAFLRETGRKLRVLNGGGEMHLVTERPTLEASIAAATIAALTAEVERLRAMEWQPMAKAKKDGTPLLLKVKDEIPGKPGDRLAGVQFVGRNILGAKDSYDYGWNFAAPVGYGGIPDEWLDGWLPLPTPPASEGGNP